MKSAEERAKEYVNAVFDKICTGHSGQIEKDIVLLLKVQDRNTRHIGAENMEKLRKSSVRLGEHDVISVDQAHNIIMNTKAI